MRKFQTFLFLLLALTYIGAHASSCGIKADYPPPSAVEQALEDN